MSQESTFAGPSLATTDHPLKLLRKPHLVPNIQLSHSAFICPQNTWVALTLPALTLPLPLPRHLRLVLLGSLAGPHSHPAAGVQGAPPLPAPGGGTRTPESVQHHRPPDTLRGASEMSSEHLEVAGWSQSPPVYDIIGEGDKVTVNNN